MKRRPHRPSFRGVGCDSRTDQGCPYSFEGLGRNRSYASPVRRPSPRQPQGCTNATATDESSDESSHARVTYRVLTRVSQGIAARRFLSGRGRRERVRETEPVGSHPYPPFHDGRASALRHDTMERVPPMPCARLTRDTRWGLGSRGSTGQTTGASRWFGSGSCSSVRTRSGGAFESDEGCERSGSTERGSSSHAGAGGRHPVHESAPPSWAPRGPARHDASVARARTEAGAPRPRATSASILQRELWGSSRATRTNDGDASST